MQTESLYPSYFAGPRRDGAVSVTTTATGKIAWSRELGLADADARSALLLWGDHVVATTVSSMALFSKEGERLWQQSRMPGSPPVIANGFLYYENRRLKLEAVDLENELAVRNAPLPTAMNDEFAISLLWPRESDFIATAFWPGHEPEELAEVSWDRTPYGERVSAKGGDYEGWQSLPPLYHPQLNRLLLCVTEDLYVIDVEQGSEVARFKIPLDEASDWSIDTEGTLHIIGYQGDEKVLLALSLNGQEKWRWQGLGRAEQWLGIQPPISAGSERMYAVTDRQILAIEAGQLLWQHEVTGGSAKHATSLADGSLLLAAGNSLSHINRDGETLFTLALDEEIQTPPVVDASGSIYVGTAKHLVKVE